MGGNIEDYNEFEYREIDWIEEEVEKWMEKRIKERELGSKDMNERKNDER